MPCPELSYHLEIPSLPLLAFVMNVLEATCLPAQRELIYWQLTQ